MPIIQYIYTLIYLRKVELGKFYIKLSSNGTDTEEDLSADNIKKARIRFRPGKRLQKMIRNLEYEKVSD